MVVPPVPSCSKLVSFPLGNSYRAVVLSGAQARFSRGEITRDALPPRLDAICANRSVVMAALVIVEAVSPSEA